MFRYSDRERVTKISAMLLAALETRRNLNDLFIFSVDSVNIDFPISPNYLFVMFLLIMGWDSVYFILITNIRHFN
jgi:hypothetical protein